MGFCVAAHYRISIMNTVYFTREIRFLLCNDFEITSSTCHQQAIDCHHLFTKPTIDSTENSWLRLTSIYNTIWFPIGWLFLWSVVGYLHPTVLSSELLKHINVGINFLHLRIELVHFLSYFISTLRRTDWHNKIAK